MAKSLSVDLRKRVVAAVEGGLSRRAAAERFGVSASSAVRWTQTGAKTAKPQGGDKRPRRLSGRFTNSSCILFMPSIFDNKINEL